MAGTPSGVRGRHEQEGTERTEAGLRGKQVSGARHQVSGREKRKADESGGSGE